MNIKKVFLGSGMSLLMAGAMFLTPMAFADGGNSVSGISTIQIPSQNQFTFSSFSNPLQLEQSKESVNASYASMYNTSTSFAQQFNISATSDMTKLLQNLESVFSQGMNSLGGYGL